MQSIPTGGLVETRHSGVRMSAIAAGCFRLIAAGLFRRLCKRASGSPHLARWAHAGYGVLVTTGAREACHAGRRSVAADTACQQPCILYSNEYTTACS